MTNHIEQSSENGGLFVDATEAQPGNNGVPAEAPRPGKAPLLGQVKKYETGEQLATAPVVAGGEVVAVSAESGATIWTLPVKNGSLRTPVLAKGR